MDVAKLLELENLLVPIVIAVTWLVWRISQNESKIKEGESRDEVMERNFGERMESLEERFVEHERRCVEMQDKLYEKLDKLTEAVYEVKGDIKHASCLVPEDRK